MMDLSDRHPSTQNVAQFFAYDYLPQFLQPVSKACHDVAEAMIRDLSDGPELVVGLRKLLEAKDCFVRTRLLEQP